MDDKNAWLHRCRVLQDVFTIFLRMSITFLLIYPPAFVANIRQTFIPTQSKNRMFIFVDFKKIYDDENERFICNGMSSLFISTSGSFYHPAFKNNCILLAFSNPSKYYKVPILTRVPIPKWVAAFAKIMNKISNKNCISAYLLDTNNFDDHIEIWQHVPLWI